MLCGIPNVQYDEFYEFDGNNRNQVNNFIKALFYYLTYYELIKTIDNFWVDYTHLNNKNEPLYSDEFIRSSKCIHGINSHLWYQKYYLPCTKVLGFIVCMVT